MRLQLRFSPLDSRVASLGEVFAAALAVAGRSASGRITMPLPSAERASTSPRIGGRRQLAGGVEIVEVDRGAGRQFLHLTLTEPVPGGALDGSRRLVEGAAGGLDRGQPAQPVGMFL